MGSIVFSDSYTVSGVGYKSFSVRISYSESYHAETNKTTLTITAVELQMADNTVNWGQLPFFGSVKVEGTTLLSMNGGAAVRVSLSGAGYNAVSIPASGSVEIAHNDDGSKSVAFTLTGGLNNYFAASYNGKAFGVGSVSRTVALSSHARGSAVTSYSSSVATQSSFELSVARNSSAFYHKASFQAGGTTLYTSDAFATSLSHTVPRSWFADFPTSASLDVAVSVQTYADAACTAAVGSPVTVNITVSADADMRPSVSSGWAALAPYNVGAAASLTGYIKGYSRAEASFDETRISMTAAVGASIASYSVSCLGESVSASPYRTGLLTSGSVSVVCTVTDTRGRSASESFSLAVMDYARPVLTGIEVFRCSSLGAADEDGTCYSAKAVLTFSPLNGQNSCSLAAAHKAAGGSYGSASALTSGTVSVIGPISADQSYTVKLSALDALGNTAEYYCTIPTRKWAMQFRPDGSGAAFGKAAETDECFEVSPDWTVRLGQPLPVSSGGTGADNAADARANLGVSGISALDVYPVGSIFLSVDPTSPATLFGGTWVRLEDRFLLGAGSTYTAGDTGGEAVHTLTKNELPAEKLGIYVSSTWLGYKNTTASAGSGIAGLGAQTGTELKTANMGSGYAHNNMPPYLVVYMWKRTA